MTQCAAQKEANILNRDPRFYAEVIMREDGTYTVKINHLPDFNIYED